MFDKYSNSMTTVFGRFGMKQRETEQKYGTLQTKSIWCMSNNKLRHQFSIESKTPKIKSGMLFASLTRE